MLKDYVNRTKILVEDGEWVDDEFMQMAARCYKRPVCLMSFDFKDL